MDKNQLLVLLLIFSLLSFMFLPSASAKTGFGPAEMYVSNQRNSLIIGNATLVNGDNEAKYGVFSLIMPYSDKDTYQVVPSEIIHARVLCKNCGSMQRYEAIPGYVYGDPLVCTLPGCSDCIFYDVMPRDEYQHFSVVASGNFHLEKIDHHTWKTKELITPQGYCNVNVLYDASASYYDANMGQHWEIHLRGKTITSEGGDFMSGGIDLRVLVDFKFPLHIKILDNFEKGNTFRVQIQYGPSDKKWLKTPTEPITVDFNGIKDLTDSNGIATFTFPDTQYDYDYQLTAMSTDNFLSATKTVNINDPDMSENSWNIFDFFGNIYVIIAVFIIIGICIAVVVVRHYFTWD